jgi:hypothetical protein
MKKKFISVALAILVFGSVSLSSCIGSFGLTNKVYNWNKSASDNKFVNELVFFAMLVIPVYEATTFIDGILLNSIEFWSGSNPVTAGNVKTIKGEKDTFRVESLSNGYKIQNTAGDEISLIMDQESNTWSVVSGDISTKLLKITGNDDAIVYLANGSEARVSLSEAGLLAFRQVIDNAGFVAAN